MADALSIGMTLDITPDLTKAQDPAVTDQDIIDYMAEMSSSVYRAGRLKLIRLVGRDVTYVGRIGDFNDVDPEHIELYTRPVDGIETFLRYEGHPGARGTARAMNLILDFMARNSQKVQL